MNYMAGAWANKMANLEKQAEHAIREDGSINPLFKQEYVDDLIEQYQKARAWQLHWLKQDD